MPTAAPYGSWRSPIGGDLVAAGGVSLDEVRVAGEAVLWLEGRPLEGGREVVCRAGPGGPGGPRGGPPENPGGEAEDLTPEGFNVRTRVHEYGGGAYAVHGTTVVFANFGDQRLYRHDPGRPPRPITPAAPTPAAHRYADASLTPDGRLLVCVRERHEHGKVTNELVALPADGAAAPVVPVAGRDFYASPRCSPDGRRLAWLEWDHPNMPWDATELKVAELATGAGAAATVAGGPGESIFQPEWSPDGVLHFVSDRSGWWNLYRAAAPGDRLACVAGSATRSAAVVVIDPASGGVEVLRRGRDETPDPGYLSAPRAIQFPTTGGRTANALYYPPANRDFRGPEGELPPLLVTSHGGPTAAVSSLLSMGYQFFTSRGFAVVDVDYGGSTGYGRAYRRQLDGQWGIVDVDDCVAAARQLAEWGEVDPRRLAIRGGSAGGWTTLCALTFRDDFAAGASYAGVADAEALARDTHKFESRYLDGLIGPWPDAAELYRQRSPIHFTDRLSCPVILLHGLDDEIVPPAQAEAMAAALDGKRIPYAYVAFAGEQHGFRQAEHIRRAVEAELYFYSRVFGFDLADPVDPVPIAHL